MLDLKFIKENPDIVKKDLIKRAQKEKLIWVDDIIKKEKDYRDLLQINQDFRCRRNIITDEINQLKKQGKDISDKVDEAKKLPQKIRNSDEEIEKLHQEVYYYLMRLPNILHESVPVGKDESQNKVVRTWGKKPKFTFQLKTHGELIEELEMGNFEQAAKVSGKGFYYLIGDLALMEHALQRFAIDFLVKKGLKLILPPLMLRRKPYEGVTDLTDFETMMYKVEDEDAYLIATSEHPIAALFMDKIFNEKELPIRLCGISTCFRKEIGSHGIDERGLFRVHQFNKIEQFIFCEPKDSWKFHEELIENAENLFQKLELPYRIVNICAGDIGTIAAKKYDLEVWMPRENAYKEVVSCSNCTSYQAVRINIKTTKKMRKNISIP